MVKRGENFLTLEALKTPCRDFKSDIFGLKIGSKKYHLYPKYPIPSPVNVLYNTPDILRNTVNRFN